MLRADIAGWLSDIRTGAHAASSLPQVDLPPLDELDLAVTLDPPEELTQEALLGRYQALAEARAPRTRLDKEAELAIGDEVVVDLITRYRVEEEPGALVPFGATRARRMTVEPHPELPSLMGALLTMKVGGALRIHEILPPDYPKEELRGQQVELIVRVLAAYRPQPLDPEAPDFVEAMGGDPETGVPGLMEQLIEQWMDEQSDQLRARAVDVVIGRLIEAHGPAIPDALIDQELTRRWAQAEGALLMAAGMSEEHTGAALSAWVQDPPLRADAHHRISQGLILRALWPRLAGPLDSLDLRELAEQLAVHLDGDADQMMAILEGEPRIAVQMVEPTLVLTARRLLADQLEVELRSEPGEN